MNLTVVLAMALAQTEGPPVVAPPDFGSDEHVERLSGGKAELWKRMGSRFFASAEGQAFFRDAGPFRGCDAYKAVRDDVTKRYYPPFRGKLLRAYRDIVPPDVMATAVAGSSSPALYPFKSRLGKALDLRTLALVDFATKELAAGLSSWLRRERLEGARLGVGPRGDFWYGGNYAIIGLVCATPGDEQRRRIIGWQGVN